MFSVLIIGAVSILCKKILFNNLIIVGILVIEVYKVRSCHKFLDSI